MTSSSRKSSLSSSRLLSLVSSFGASTERSGIAAALGAAVFLGLTPVLGKIALALGVAPLAVVAWRTGLATLLLLIPIALLQRRYLYIFPAGLLGCGLAGLLNGAGSILFYMALQRLEASVGQLLFSLYPFFVALWMIVDGQTPSRLTFARIALAIGGVLLLTTFQARPSDPVGILMMLGAAALYALHLPINQRVLYEVPPPTVTLYTLIAMTAVVVPAFVVFGRGTMITPTAWYPILGLTLVTLLSRLSLFLGVKQIGGMQTAVLGLAEILVTVSFSGLWLHETLSALQWVGAATLVSSLLLVRFEHPAPRRADMKGWFAWIRPPRLPRDAPWSPHE
jgi:drug/metabolite transporter (DMT)-like permease